MRILFLIMAWIGFSTSVQADEWQSRLDNVDTNLSDYDAYARDSVTHSVSVLGKQDKDAITLVAETDTTYPMVRWLNREGQFMGGLVCHERKITSSGQLARDDHCSFYVRQKDGSREGILNIEFNEDMQSDDPAKLPMISIKNAAVRLVGKAFLTVLSPSNKRFRINVDDNGNLSAERVYLDSDTQIEDES